MLTEVNFISGGGCTKDKEGNLILIKDQDVGAAPARSLLNNQTLNVPVGLIIGNINHPTYQAVLV